MKKENAKFLARAIVHKVSRMQAGTVTNVARLVKSFDWDLSAEELNSQTFLDDIMFDITNEFLDLAEQDENLLIDMSCHEWKIEDQPFNLHFIVRKRRDKPLTNTEELLDMLEWFEFEIDECFVGSSAITFRINDKDRWIKLLNDDAPYYDEKYEVEESEIVALKTLIRECGVLTWERDYYEPVLDGTSWNLHLRFSDGTFFESSGMNGFPEGYDVLLNGLERLGLNGD